MSITLCITACSRNQSIRPVPISYPEPHTSGNFSYYTFWLNPNIPVADIFSGDTVLFKVYCTSDTFQLNFGDGNIASDTFSKHVYQVPGKYLVTLTKGTDTLQMQTIDIKNLPDSALTQHLTSIREWSCCYTYDCSQSSNNETFAVIALGKGRIVFKDDTLAFDSKTDTTTAFPYLYYHGIQGPPFHGCDFYYFYLQDSILASTWSDIPSGPSYFRSL